MHDLIYIAFQNTLEGCLSLHPRERERATPGWHPCLHICLLWTACVEYHMFSWISGWCLSYTIMSFSSYANIHSTSVVDIWMDISSLLTEFICSPLRADCEGGATYSRPWRPHQCLQHGGHIECTASMPQLCDTARRYNALLSHGMTTPNRLHFPSYLLCCLRLQLLCQVHMLLEIGRFSEMTYIFETLKQSHQFQLLFTEKSVKVR